MAGRGRRRLEIPGRIFRLAVRDLRAAAAAPENLGAPEEALAPPPPPPPPPRHGVPGTVDLDLDLAVQETAETQQRGVPNLEEAGQERRDDSVGGQGDKKRRADSLGTEAHSSKKRRANSIGAEVRGSRLSADAFGLFKGKPTGAREGTFSSSEDLATAGTSGGRPESCNQELVNLDVAQKAKNDLETLDFIEEMEARYSLDAYRQRFAITNSLPLPPPSWDRVPTPPVPSSRPPPVVEISNSEEARTALTAWSNGCEVHLKVSEQLLLSEAEHISDIVKDAHAERVVLNISLLETKATQAMFLQKMIKHNMGEAERYYKMLLLPWIPTPTVIGCDLLQ